MRFAHGDRGLAEGDRSQTRPRPDLAPVQDHPKGWRRKKTCKGADNQTDEQRNHGNLLLREASVRP
jgi:hypothetical protein